jgi:hypothetical protein
MKTSMRSTSNADLPLLEIRFSTRLDLQLVLTSFMHGRAITILLLSQEHSNLRTRYRNAPNHLNKPTSDRSIEICCFPLTTPEETGCEKSQGKFDLQWTWGEQPYALSMERLQHSQLSIVTKNSQVCPFPGRRWPLSQQWTRKMLSERKKMRWPVGRSLRWVYSVFQISSHFFHVPFTQFLQSLRRVSTPYRHSQSFVEYRF